jgi:hypothetical protein
MMENDFNGSTKSRNFQLNSNLISRKSKEFQIKKNNNHHHHRRQLPAIVSRAFILLPRKTLELLLAAMISIDRFESARQSFLLAPLLYTQKRPFTRERERLQPITSRRPADKKGTKKV